MPGRAGGRPWPVAVPFDQYQRYRIAAEIADAISTGDCAGRVLDVGGYHQGPGGEPRRPIRNFLPHWMSITVDLGTHPLSGYVEASGDHLPFADGSFEAATCLDVLEHVPAEQRPGVIAELCRVAGRVVVLAAPFRDARVIASEELLADFILRTWKEPQAQLAEHRERGWPDLAQTMAAFRAAGWTVETFGHGNLWRWLFMMIDKHAVLRLPHALEMHGRMDASYNETDFEIDGAPPWYRHFVVAWKRPDDPARAVVGRRFAPTPSAASDCPSATMTGADREMLALAAAHARNQATVVEMEPARRDAQLAASEAHREELYRHLHAKDEYIRKLEKLLSDVEQSLSYRVARAIRTVLPRSADRPHRND